ncbi:transketolase family protein [Acidithiobacillus sp. HP-11]|uniref:transketolase family protein n=1 Tax=Acidithiobacillus sp. HP-11 TaxID=2697656 RepID=UPI001879300D|nr:transketolase [Acidithiobacillus sp. HP-11]MBE7565746.1 transketolase [Acidithiobacillus sp. HP-11]
MRSAFIDELVRAAAIHDNIVLIIGDLGFGVVEPFATCFPNRFFNAGVAEQNMMGMAAGLASEGFHVFIYSIANFPTLRCAEQIRNDVDYHDLPVTIVAVGGGVAYGNLGYSHHAVQDYALLRTMPNMLIAAPGDPMEVRACMRYLINNPQPSYLRLGKAGEPCIHSDVPLVHPGQWLKIGNSLETSKTYLTTGATLDLIYGILTSKREMHDWALHSMPLWGMKSKALQTEQLLKFTQVITVEDHLMDAGFGSWLMEAVSSEPQLLSRVEIKALDASVCGMVGKQSTLNAACGLHENKL